MASQRLASIFHMDKKFDAVILAHKPASCVSRAEPSVAMTPGSAGLVRGSGSHEVEVWSVTERHLSSASTCLSKTS